MNEFSCQPTTEFNEGSRCALLDALSCRPPKQVNNMPPAIPQYDKITVTLSKVPLSTISVSAQRPAQARENPSWPTSSRAEQQVAALLWNLFVFDVFVRHLFHPTILRAQQLSKCHDTLFLQVFVPTSLPAETCTSHWDSSST